MKNKNNFFDLSRFAALFRLELTRVKKYALITLGATVGIMFLISIMIVGFTPNIDFSSFYYVGLYISGILLAGTAFPDFRKKETAMMYLTLPASVFEKLLSQIFIVSFGFVIFYSVAFLLYWGVVFVWRSFLQLDTQLPFYIFGSNEFIHSVLYLWFWQSVFLVGSAAFNKAPLVKTMAVVFVVIAFLSVYVMFILTKFVFDNMQLGSHMMFHSNVSLFNTDLLLLLIPVFWIAAYLKIKEKQV